MAKSTATYWNPLQAKHADKWAAIEGANGMIEQLLPFAKFGRLNLSFVVVRCARDPPFPLY